MYRQQYFRVDGFVWLGITQKRASLLRSCKNETNQSRPKFNTRINCHIEGALFTVHSRSSNKVNLILQETK